MSRSADSEVVVESNGRRLAIQMWGGRGDAVLCWHGVGFAACGGRKFAELAPRLVRQGFRVLALDAPGFGRSPALQPEGYHPHSLADLVPGLLDAFEIERALFLGFSWGGDVGCHVAARHADRLVGLILLDAGYRDPPFDPAVPYETYVKQNERKAEALADTIVEPWLVAAVERGMAVGPPSATRERVAAGRLPVLLVAAGEAPSTDLEQFARDVPQARIYRLDGFGHNVLSDGGETVARLIERWPGGPGSSRAAS